MGTPADPEPRRRWPWLLALAFACGASFPFLGRMMNANERPRLLQAVAWVDHGTLALDPMIARGFDPGVDVARAPAERGGALYPNKPPGATVPAVIAYAVQRAWCGVTGEVPTLRGLTLGARWLGALLPVLVLAGFAWRRCGDDEHARFAVLVTVLATPLQSYAHVLFGHSLAALCLFVGTTWIADALDAQRSTLNARRSTLNAQRSTLDARRSTLNAQRSTLRTAALGGACAGAAVLVEYAAVLAAIPIGIFLITRARRDGIATPLAALTGALLPIALLALYHAHAFGSPWSTGYHHVVDTGFAELHGRGLLGLTVPKLGDVAEDLVSPWGGLLYFAPLVVLTPLAWRLAPSHEAGSHVRLQLAVSLALLVGTLCIAQAGGWRVGPRYLVAGLPALAPALALVLRRRGDSEVLLALVLGLALWSLAIDSLTANLFPHLIPAGNPLRDQLVPLAMRGLQPYSALDGFTGARALATVLPIAVAFALALAAAAPIVPKPLRLRVGLGATVIAAAIALVAWSLPPADDADASLAAIVSIWEPGGERPPLVVPLRTPDPNL